MKKDLIAKNMAVLCDLSNHYSNNIMISDWSGKTAFLLGGGPSLPRLLDEIEECISPKYRIIAINDSIYTCLQADVLFFRDIAWFYGNRKIVDMWNGTIVSSTPCDIYPKKVNVVKTKHCDDFLIGGDTIKYGRSGGHLALSYAINRGAKRCVLLGYDCRVVDDQSHFHSWGKKTASVVYSHDFLPAWAGWGEAAKRANVEVWNATPGSAIREFPHVPFYEVLS